MTKRSQPCAVSAIPNQSRRRLPKAQHKAIRSVPGQIRDKRAGLLSGGARHRQIASVACWKDAASAGSAPQAVIRPMRPISPIPRPPLTKQLPTPFAKASVVPQMNRRHFLKSSLAGSAAALAVTATASEAPASQPSFHARSSEWDEATIAQLRSAMQAGRLTAAALTRHYLAPHPRLGSARPQAQFRHRTQS
jgi:hypothetical protein